MKKWSENWYTKHRWLINTNLQISFLIIEILIFVIYYCIVLSSSPETWSFFGLHPLTYEQRMFWNVVLFVLGVQGMIIIVIVFKLRHCHGDVFRLKNEVTCSGSCLILMMIISWYFFRQQYSRVYTSVLLLTGIHFLIVISTVWPVYLVHQEKKFSRSSREIKLSLNDVLRDKMGFNLFLNYLEKEFSSENLVFWEQVEILKTLEDPKLIYNKVISIFTTFISPQSNYYINLPHEIRDLISQNMENLDRDGILCPNNNNTISSKQISTSLSHNSLQNFIEMIPKQEQLSSSLISGNDIRYIMDIAQKNVYDSLANDSFIRFQNQLGIKEKLVEIQMSFISV